MCYSPLRSAQTDRLEETSTEPSSQRWRMMREPLFGGMGGLSQFHEGEPGMSGVLRETGEGAVLSGMTQR